MDSSKAFLYLVFFLFSLHFFTVFATEFAVGGDKGWAVPKVKDDQVYDQWAGKNRFKIGDTLSFEYKKDSVLVVTKEEYEKCKSSHPIFFSNNGKTIYKLEQPGLYYFISGVSGHCERGLKMIIKVLEPESPPQSANQTSPTSSGTTAAATPTTMAFVVSLFGALLY
ncbi:early nodulin-like protein 5 [Nicotiana tabacum]|uniref:Mavicyanin n=1 Tax=Nicotiana tabacum TaxID=4097 RepID=Q9ZNX8_TOBAC|nr:mavicyanin-like [Nicotiana tomentosiformis]XP_016471363.1 PREDICTED: mavicyanin-like [Nicotiana tabacum]BAA75495.1 NtEPc [Nicotiana tabacum]